MCLHGEVKSRGKVVDHLLQRLVLKWDDVPAVGADEVMVVVILAGGLVTSYALADLDAADQAKLLEFVKYPVDARTPDGSRALCL